MKVKKIFISLISALLVFLTLAGGTGCNTLCSLGLHQYGDDWTSVTDASCTQSGERRRVCIICGLGNVTEKTEPIGHAFGAWHDAVVTCTQHTQYAECTRCLIRETRNVAAVGHSYNNGVCSYCGAKRTTIDDANIDKLNGTYGRDYLERYGTNAEVEFYDRIAELAKKFHAGKLTATKTEDNKKNVYYIAGEVQFKDLKLTVERATAIWQLFRYDNPVYYWISTRLTYNTERINLVCSDDYASIDARLAATNAIYSQMGEWVEKIDAKANDYFKALTIHDIITKSISYALTPDGKPQPADWAHSISGAFINKSGVCETYAKSFQLMLNYFDIENILVAGESKTLDGKSGEDHAWNLVKIDGNWYWCDLTWDDVAISSFGIAHNNFMVNDTQNVNLYDWRTNIKAGTFLDRHIAFKETGDAQKFLYSLPARARNPYSGAYAVRSTFEITDGASKATYAINGYDSAQLVKVEGYETFIMPEMVQNGGKNFSVTAVGAFKDGIYIDASVLDDKIKRFVVSSVVEAIYESALISPSIMEYVVAAGNKKFVSYGGALFTANMRTLAFYPAASVATQFKLPGQTTRIAGRAIRAAKNLSELDIGYNEISIGWYNCGFGLDTDSQQLENYTWGHIASEVASSFRVRAEGNPSFKTRGDGFYDAQDVLLIVMDRTLHSFVLPRSVMGISEYAFYGMTKLNGVINYSGTMEQWKTLIKSAKPQWNYVDGKTKINKIVCADVIVSI